jgi:hypothetical protein
MIAHISESRSEQRRAEEEQASQQSLRTIQRAFRKAMLALPPEGSGSLANATNQEVEYLASATPGLARLRVTVTQREILCSAEALLTITDSLEVAMAPAVVNTRGLPGYTFERAAGELWRSRLDLERNLMVVNSGHRDFVFATRNRALQLRYLVRLYVKELVLRNFTGVSAEQLLERMIELSLYAEEKLRSG